MKEMSFKEKVAGSIAIGVMIIGFLVMPIMVDSGIVKFYSTGVYGLVSCLLGVCSAFVAALIAGIQIGTGKLIRYKDLKPGKYTFVGWRFCQDIKKPSIMVVSRKSFFSNILGKKWLRFLRGNKFIGELPESVPVLSPGQEFTLEHVAKQVINAYKKINPV